MILRPQKHQQNSADRKLVKDKISRGGNIKKRGTKGKDTLRGTRVRVRMFRRPLWPQKHHQNLAVRKLAKNMIAKGGDIT